MKKSIFLAVALGLFLVAAPAFAESPVITGEMGYYVLPGDTLWELSADRLHDPFKWGQVVGANPFLQQTGRVFDRRGKTIVLIRPGEKLVGLEQLGVVPMPVPIEQLQALPTPAPKIPQVPQQSWGTSLLFFALDYWPLLLALLFAAIAVLIYWYMRRQEQRRPASQAGPAVVHGGIRLNEPARVEERFQNIADQHYMAANPVANLGIARPVRVSEVEHGFLSGRGRVEYAGGVMQERTMNREPAYRARFRMPDGTEETLHFLREGANDVTFSGTRYTGYTFEPSTGRDRVVVLAPAPAPAQPAATPVEEPAATGATASPQAEVVPLRPTPMVVTLEGLRITLPEGSVVETDGGEIALTLQRSGEVRIRRVATRREKKAASQQPPASPRSVA